MSSTEPSSTEYVDCTVLYEKFSRCMSPGAQVQHIHRHAVSKDCGALFSDWKTCLYTKMVKDEAKVKELFEGMSYYKEKQSSHKNDVFVYKEKPSWEI